MQRMPTPTSWSNGQQLELLPDPSSWAPSAGTPSRPREAHHRATSVRTSRAAAGGAGPRRDRIAVDLRGLRSHLEAKAAQDGTTMAVQVRRAVALMLDQAGPESISIAVSSDTSAGSVVNVALRMSAARAVLLTRRARAADVAQGRSSVRCWMARSRHRGPPIMARRSPS